MKTRAFFITILATGLILLAGSAYAELSTNLQIRKETDPKNRKISTWTYIGRDGNPAFADDKGYAAVRYTYKEGKLAELTEYLDLDGKLINNIDGYAMKTCTYSGKKLTETIYMDSRGYQVTGPEGYARKNTKYWYNKHHTTWEYDPEGNPVNLHRITEFCGDEHPSLIRNDSWYDTEGNLAAGPNGYARVEYEYRRTTVRKTTYLDADGGLYYYAGEGYAVKEYTYKDNRIHELNYYGADGELTAGPDGYAKAVYSYVNGDGHVRRIMYYNADGTLFFTNKGYCGIQRSYTVKGDVTDESYFLGEDQRGYSTDGYSRVTKKLNRKRKVGIQTYYDDQDNRMIPESIGYAEKRNTYTNNSKVLTRTEYYDEKGEPMIGPDGYFAVNYKIEKNAVIQATYYDIDSKTLINGSKGYAKIVYQNDENKNCISKTYYDADGNRFIVGNNADEIRYEWSGGLQVSESYWANNEPVTNEKGYHKIVKEYTGNEKVSNQYYLDIDGNPVSVAEGYARTENLYNSKGKVMATLYYDAAGNLTLTPGKEYAYVRTITEQDRKLLNDPEYIEEEEEKPEDEDPENEPEKDEDEEEDERDTGHGEEDIPTEEEEPSTAGIVYIEYYGTDGQLMNLSAGYAIIVRQTDRNGKTVGQAYYDRNGNKVLLAGGYHSYRQEYGADGFAASTAYYGLEGEPVINTKEKYHRIERTYWNKNHYTSEAWFDEKGEPIPLKDTYVRIEREFDERGNVIHAVTYDGEGKKIARKAGYDEIRQEFNEKNKATRIEYYLDGKPILLKEGYATLEREYDERGNKCLERYFGEDGKGILIPGGYQSYTQVTGEDGFAASIAYYGLEGEPVINTKEKYHRIERTYWNKNHYTSEAWFNEKGEPIPLKDTYVRIEREFDERGNAIHAVTYGADGKKIARKAGYDEILQAFNGSNRAVRIEYYLDGEPVLLKDGYAALEREYDEAGNVISERCYDAELNPAPCKKGYASFLKEYDENKRVVYEAWFDAKDSAIPMNGDLYYAIEREYDEKGRARVLRYLNEYSMPTQCRAGYEAVEREFDNNKKVIRETYMDYNGQPMADSKGVYQTTYEYDEKGNRVRENYLDMNGRPMVSSEGFTGKEWTYSKKGKVTGETGIMPDEAEGTSGN